MLRNVLFILSVISSRYSSDSNNNVSTKDYEILNGYSQKVLELQEYIEKDLKDKINNFYNEMIKVLKDGTVGITSHVFKYTYRKNGETIAEFEEFSIKEIINLIEASIHRDSCTQPALYKAQNNFNILNTKLSSANEKFKEGNIKENEKTRLLKEIKEKILLYKSEVNDKIFTFEKNTNFIIKSKSEYENASDEETKKAVSWKIFNFVKMYVFRGDLCFEQENSQDFLRFDASKEFKKPKCITKELWNKLEEILKKTQSTLLKCF